MSNISRSQWYNQQISTFLLSAERELFLLLYSREVKKIANMYPELIILVGSCAGPNDKRKICRLAK